MASICPSWWAIQTFGLLGEYQMAEQSNSSFWPPETALLIPTSNKQGKADSFVVNEIVQPYKLFI